MIIQSYCRHHRLFRLSLSDQLESELFFNRTLDRRLKLPDARRVLEYMRDKEHVAEMVSLKEGGGKTKGGEGDTYWVWWRRVDDWAGLIEAWVGELFASLL